MCLNDACKNFNKKQCYRGLCVPQLVQFGELHTAFDGLVWDATVYVYATKGLIKLGPTAQSRFLMATNIHA